MSMKIDVNSATVAPMIAWLEDGRKSGNRDEKKLRQILSMPDYEIEFQRYGEPSLPVCGISFEEAVDFFLHFDEKDFENPRLSSKKEVFLPFYNDLDARLKKMEMFHSITPGDLKLVEQLLENGLPAHLLQEVNHFTILLTVSIGNSFGWPYENNIHFDVANLDTLADQESFLHVLAHEIHHIMFPRLLPKDMTPQQYFFVNFASEGLAMHFCNNAATLQKPSKYAGKMFGVDEKDWRFYEEQHQELIQKVLSDGKQAEKMTMEQVDELVKQYVQFPFTSLKTGETRKVSQYPIYYVGCCLWGRIDMALGKERLFEVLKSRDGFLRAWKALEEKSDSIA